MKRGPARNVSADSTPIHVTIRTRRIVWGVFLFCTAAIAAFFLLDYYVNYSRLTDIRQIRQTFNTTREDGAASWFMVSLTLVTALTVWTIWFIERQQAISRWRKIGWLVVALLLTLMAADDGITIHERAGSVFKAISGRADAGGEQSWGGEVLDRFRSYPWQVLFLPLYGPMGLFLVVFLWRELRHSTSRLLVAGAILCFAVAVCLDWFEGLDPDDSMNIYARILERWDITQIAQEKFDQEPYDVLEHFSKSIEECIETFGMTLLLVTFLRHWGELAPSIELRFTRPDRVPPPPRDTP